MEPPIVLRMAAAADEGFLRRLYATTRAAELDLTDWSGDQRDAFCRSQFAAQRDHYRRHYPTARFSVVERGGTPVGRLYVDRWPGEIRIVDISLLPEHRGAGIGTHLLGALIDEASSAGLPLTIHVERFNPARRLYERLGFRLREDKGVHLLMERPPSPAAARPT
jgi:GNAT superfamily N-acetyltransferase